MRKLLTRRFVPLVVAGLAVAVVPSAGLAAVTGGSATGGSAASAASASATPGGTPMKVRITGDQIPATDAPAATSGAAPSTGTGDLPSKAGQIKTLTAVLNTMQANYATLSKDNPGPADIFDYGIGDLWKQGIDGAGTTIAVLEGWDFPGIAAEVHSYDQIFGLPDPDISTIYPAGPLPATCPAGMVALGSYGSCSAWQGELALDVITAHLIAPYAKILISASPADTEVTGDAASQVAMPEIMEAAEKISSEHLANVMSVSDGTGEVTYSTGREEITAQDAAELTAAAAGVPLLVATGDCGVVQNLAEANAQCNNVSSGPDTAAWDDSPWVTAVGGSVPDVDATGHKAGPDPLWHDGIFSEGAGYSSVYTRPSYQNGVAHITGSAMRSVPDLTMDAQSGTSEAAPELAGVLDLATQLNHGADLGPVNPLLYQLLGPQGARAGIADVVSGNDSAENRSGQVTVPGFTAARGFDVASGWGTVDAAKFVPSLAAASQATGGDRAARDQAASQLQSLEHGIQLSPSTVPSGGTSYLLAGGFLPGHPVQVDIDGTTEATLTATDLGTITDMIDPAALGLAAGRHTIQLKSMLITQTASLTTR